MVETGVRKLRYARDSSIVFREIAGEMIMVPIKKTADEVDFIYTTNEVGGFIWESIDGEKEFGEILDAIVSEFEITPEAAEKDLLDFLQQLEAVGAVKKI
jgi:hypothetical protein